MYLNNITIDNARKFGKGFNIQFGEGATILLAPNGTGKTTIFEALELAITGKIERLNQNQKAIIQNGKDSMHIKLDFSNGNVYEVTYDLLGKLNKTGDINKILSIDDDVAVGYMYRMTHFFEQSKKNWFLMSSEEEAGNVLNTLPIAKDLQTILLKRTSLFHSITNMQDEILGKLENYKKDYSIIKDLVNKSEKIKTEQPEQTVENVNLSILHISNKYLLDNYAITSDIDENNRYIGRIKISLSNMNDDNKKMIAAIDSFAEKVSFYDENNEKIKEILVAVSNDQNTYNRLKQDNDELITFMNELNNRLSVINQNLSKMKLNISRTNEINSIKGRINNNNKILLSEKDKLIEYESQLSKNIALLSKHEQSINTRKVITESIIGKKNELQEFYKKVKILDECINNNKRINVLKEENQKNYIARAEVLEKLLHLKEDYDKACKEYEDAVTNRQQIKTSNQEISDSIANIKKHIKDNQKHCPLCQAEYSHDELLTRIEKSLSILSPILSDAIKSEEIAKNVFTKAKILFDNGNSNLHDIDSNIESNNKKISSLEESIRSTIEGSFSIDSDYSLERIKINKEIELINLDLDNLYQQEKNIPEGETEDRVMEARLQQEEIVRIIRDTKDKIQNLELEIENSNIQIDRLNKLLSESEIENSIDEITKFEKKADIFTNCISINRSIINQQTEKLNDINVAINNNNVKLTELKSLQAGIESEWKNFQIEGKPSTELLTIKREEVLTKCTYIASDINKLLEFENILSQWSRLSEYENTNTEIKRIVKDSSIESYINALEDNIKKLEKRSNEISDKRYALELLMDCLKSESTKIQSQLQSINNDWSEILKRIVTNPIIADATLLKSKITRNKAKANVFTHINHYETNIASVASEGQMTDLQLSFILAMAKKYSWTSWKALLLDDPIQHHDLVHSAAVFDLLRDYIVNFGYQILFSTHDEVQAKFFSRKLLNEGIANKIYYLKETKGGVVAEII